MTSAKSSKLDRSTIEERRGNVCFPSVLSFGSTISGISDTTTISQLNDAIITDYLSNVISQLGSAGTFYRTQTGCNIELNWLITSGYIQSIDKLLIFRCMKFATCRTTVTNHAKDFVLLSNRSTQTSSQFILFTSECLTLDMEFLHV